MPFIDHHFLFIAGMLLVALYAIFRLSKVFLTENTKPNDMLNDVKKSAPYKGFKKFNDSHIGGIIPRFDLGPPDQEENKEEDMFEEPLVEIQHRE